MQTSAILDNVKILHERSVGSQCLGANTRRGGNQVVGLQLRNQLLETLQKGMFA